MTTPPPTREERLAMARKLNQCVHVLRTVNGCTFEDDEYICSVIQDLQQVSKNIQPAANGEETNG